MFKDVYHPKVRKDLKKIDPPIRQRIKNEHIPYLLANHEAGELLLGDLQGIRSYHFTIAAQQFRIAYIVDEEEKILFIQMIAKRGDFYTLLKKRI